MNLVCFSPVLLCLLVRGCNKKTKTTSDPDVVGVRRTAVHREWRVILSLESAHFAGLSE